MEFFLGAFESEWEQRRAAMLHELSLGSSAASSAEEEMRRRLRELQIAGGAAAAGSGSVPKMRRPSSRALTSAGSASNKQVAIARSMETRLAAVAAGSQPAVVKMASYGGGARFGAMVNYVSRSGEICVEKENGERLQGREELARLRGDWEPLFQNRAESRDIGTFRVTIEAAGFATEEALHQHVRDSLASAFGNRSFAYAVSQPSHGVLKVEGVVVLRSMEGERLTGDSKAADIIQRRYNESAASELGRARFRFTGYGNGVEYGAAKLRSLVEDHKGDVRDHKGRVVSDARSAGDLVQKQWRRELHSRKGRDVMHVIMSAKAGTNVQAFERAVRDFLAAQFQGHRYIFAMHDPFSDPKEMGQGGKRPHIHAHAIIAMRSDAGDRVETSPQVFRQWRELMAEKAREHGIAMEMTDRREFANAPAYTRNQVRPVSCDGRTEHEGTSAAAQSRYDAKRSGRRSVARSVRSRDYTVEVTQSWEKIAMASGDRQIASYAIQQRDIVVSTSSLQSEAKTSNIVHADFGSHHRTNLVKLQNIILEGDKVREMSRSDFEAYEKEVETALFRLGRNLGPEEKADLDQVAQYTREHVNLMREHMELTEQRGLSVETPSRESEQDSSSMQIAREPDSEIAKPAHVVAEAEQGRPSADNANEPRSSMDDEEKAAAASYQAEMDRSFPSEITSRYYIREDHGGTQRVFADSKGEREVFQDNGEKLRAKSFDAQGVRLMIETAAHRGWTSIEITGSKEFRRETWLEGQAHGISVKGYQPTELDWQDLARREQSYLRNEIIPIEGRALDAAHRDQEQSAGSDQLSKVDKEQQNADNSGTPHTKPVDYKEGVQGILVETGEKPYQDNEKNQPSPFVVIETANGNRTVWGVGLPDALHRAGADIGDEIHLRSTGTERVLKTVIQEIDGQKHRVEQMVDRRAWEANVLEERDRTDEKVEGSKQLDNRVSMEAKAVVRDGETARTDPPQQQVPRLQELEHEQQQKKERDEHER
ncbi:LPD7 domain-containing protein [Brucella anthropi]|uniref:LPD7 domain-containing protein n=1 Tax=Brucella anthropi TaxID=529 RepID=UPI00244C79D5|nr:LPD7 domain-containing protein [Brucella anthropi]MDG9793455.1 relaxase [Brucella anthropi]MDH0583242.1 relaxase [Brucella anthropi]MDH0819856.1 relaxase [Brucella anthropi]MDH2086619.1 relaxase [Brucella anthropi]